MHPRWLNRFPVPAGVALGLWILLLGNRAGARVAFDGVAPDSLASFLSRSTTAGSRGPLHPNAPPDITGQGNVHTTGNVWQKVTNIGFMGNPFTAISSDPSAQWPGPSGVEYLFAYGLWFAAKNPAAEDPALVRRVTQNTEWRPPSLGPADIIYESYDGNIHAARGSDDDSDGKVDEEFQNGKDDDGDGEIDEDYEGISQKMFTCEISDNTAQAVNANFQERHVPFGIKVLQRSYSFAVPGANDFVAAEYILFNESGHELDSVYVGFQVDMDAGPTRIAGYWVDDLVDPAVPQGNYTELLSTSDPRYDATRCPIDTIHVQGFLTYDDDGDAGSTPGAPSFLLLGHTTDPTGIKGPRRVGFRTYKAYLPGTPFVQGGQPTVDIERYQTMSSIEGIDASTGLIVAERPGTENKGDYFSLCSVGPFLHWQAGERITVQVALAVQKLDYRKPRDKGSDPNPERYSAIIANAIEVQKTFRGRYLDPPPGVATPDSIGRETGVIAPQGEILYFSDCHDLESSGQPRQVTDREYTWFDFDCNYCTGVKGRILRTWLAAAPPPNPPVRLTPGDRQITIEWDNLAESTPDPSSNAFDFRAYRIWKASNFTRPVGSSGPSEDLWALLGEFRAYDQYYPLVDSVDTDQDGAFDDTVHVYPVLVNVQSGERLYPQDVPPLTNTETGDTLFAIGLREYLDDAGAFVTIPLKVPRYPIGRYRLVDPNVLNGFVYFYSVTGQDSTGRPGPGGTRGTVAMQEGRRAAIESDGVTPQAAGSDDNKNVFVVPNPYRGHAQWDLTPNAADPTGTHVDFFRMPHGAWVLRIFTVSGDLVQEIRNTDIQVNGKPQQETPDDGQATWNLVSRNGQDVVSGIYLFSVESDGTTSQGKFVVVR